MLQLIWAGGGGWKIGVKITVVDQLRVLHVGLVKIYRELQISEGLRK